jgi:hypothetical protein
MRSRLREVFIREKSRFRQVFARGRGDDGVSDVSSYQLANEVPMKLAIAALAAFLSSLGLSALPAAAQEPLKVKPLAEKKVPELPAGELYWRVENFPSLADAQAAAGSHSLATEAAGKAWLFTLGSEREPAPRGSPVAKVGPIPRVRAAQYLLRINEARGAPGSITPVHTHPGSEAFFVLTGEQSIRSAHGTMRVRAGQAEAGHGADMAMQVSSSGPGDLHALVMFVVDAARPFSSPAKLP